MNTADPSRSDPTDRARIEELLDRAVEAVNQGDHVAASRLAEQVLAADRDSQDAEDLLTAPIDGGEIRRLTIMFADLVDSTVLSTQIEPETYRLVVGRYRDVVREAVERYEGHIASTKGDGLLAVFGHPNAHENDVQRSVQAGLDIVQNVVRLSVSVRNKFGFDIHVRVGIHRGLVYLDTVEDDVYGLGANLTARISGLAPPDAVAVSNAIQRLVAADFDLESQPPQHVKGISGPVEYHLVVAERPQSATADIGPIVGRDRELAFLEQVWGQALASTLTGAGVGFVGEAGMGKSRLVAAAAGLAEQSGATILELHGSPFHTEAGLYPIRVLLENRCNITRSTSQSEKLRLLEAELTLRSLDPAAAVPLLAPVLGIAAETGYEPAQAGAGKLYARIRTAVCDYLVACLGADPGLILVEDLHWFDPSTLDVVEYLLRRETTRLLTVVTTRNADQLHDLAESTGLTTFELAPLNSAETDQLIDALNPGVSEQYRAEVHRRCDGVPLYIEEVVTKLDQQQGDSANWQRVPDALYEPLFASLRASKNTVKVVAAAAIVGREVDRGLLMSVLDMPREEVDKAVSELVATRVLIPMANDSARFRHELLREVAVEFSPPSQRRRLHGRVADALTDATYEQPDWNLVAIHCEEAGRFGEAANAYRQTSSEARRRGALLEARNQLSRAITNAERMPDGRDRDRRLAALLVRRGFLISSIAGTTSTEAAADFERCLELSGVQLTDDLRATMQALVGYYLSRGHMNRVDQLLRSGRVLSSAGPDWMQHATEAGFATAAWYEGDFSTARTQLEHLATSTNDADSTEIETLWFIPHEPGASLWTLLSMARFVQGDLAGMESALGRAHDRCAAVGFPHGPFSLAYAHSMEVWMRYECGQYAVAAQRVSDLSEIARRHGFDSWRLLAGAEHVLVAATTFLAEGVSDPTAADGHIAAISAVVQAMLDADIPTFVSVYYAALAKLLLAVGRPEQARDELDAALTLTGRLGVGHHDPELLRLRALTADGAQRLTELQAAVDLAAQRGAAVFQLRAATDLFVFGGDATRQQLADALAAIPAGNSWPEVSRAEALLG